MQMTETPYPLNLGKSLRNSMGQLLKLSSACLFILLLSASLQSQPPISWQRALGGDDLDEGYAVEQTSDDGFIVAGKSSSTDGDISQNAGGQDFWIVKLDRDGNIEWEKSLLDE